MKPIPIPPRGRRPLQQSTTFMFPLVRLPCLLVLNLIAVTLASLTAPAAEPTPDPTVASVYAPIAPLIGGMWRGDLPPGPNGTKVEIELKADWAANHQGIRFDGAFVVNGRRSPYTSGMYAWNPVNKHLSFFYTDDDGNLIEGGVTMENGVLVHNFTIAETKGTTSKVQARITFAGPDTFTNEILKWKDEKWEKFVTVRYQRSSP
ncbi:MAG: hypothetical protein ABI992_06685 [Chthoniobacterales bacterium]